MKKFHLLKSFDITIKYSIEWKKFKELTKKAKAESKENEQEDYIETPDYASIEYFYQSSYVSFIDNIIIYFNFFKILFQKFQKLEILLKVKYIMLFSIK